MDYGIRKSGLVLISERGESIMREQFAERLVKGGYKARMGVCRIENVYLAEAHMGVMNVFQTLFCFQPFKTSFKATITLPASSISSIAIRSKGV